MIRQLAKTNKSVYRIFLSCLHINPKLSRVLGVNMFCDFKIVRLDISLDISVQTKQIKVIQDGASLGHPKKKKKKILSLIFQELFKKFSTP